MISLSFSPSSLLLLLIQLNIIAITILHNDCRYCDHFLLTKFLVFGASIYNICAHATMNTSTHMYTGALAAESDQLRSSNQP